MKELPKILTRYIYNSISNAVITHVYTQESGQIYRSESSGLAKTYNYIMRETSSSEVECLIKIYCEQKKKILERIHSGKRKIREAEADLKSLNQKINGEQLLKENPDLMI